ncbi:hypothetical protein [Gaoshiqia sp. Z1-71]|uniref:hypothetical protein n=1 Tax=Gaoshiqia hydrogeniformans TaxID=3290090 RepID=UPI003BF85B1B
MDRNKLIRIIQKDLEELNEITQGLGDKTRLTNYEIEFALSKSRILLQEFEFLKEINSAETETSPPKSDTSLVERVKQEISQAEELVISLPEQAEIHLPEKQPEAVVSEKAETPAPAPEAKVAEPTNGFSTEALPEAEKSTVGANPKHPEAESDEAEPGKKIVADTLSQGKSLNELLAGVGKLDQQLASSPISKLESAIGLNDRFQYIRELFNHDAGLYQTTIRQLDQMQNLDEAVGYLSNNFKWRKNDTSIKFAQLVKRRFSN